MRSATFDKGRLLALREDQGFTQASLAAKVTKQLGRNVDPSTISHLERGSRQPGAELYRAICRALGVKSDALRVVTDDRAA